MNCPVRWRRTSARYLVAMNRHGELADRRRGGRERERYGLTYGAKVNVREGQKIDPKQLRVGVGCVRVPILTEVLRHREVRRRHRRRHHAGAARRAHGSGRARSSSSQGPDTRPRITIRTTTAARPRRSAGATGARVTRRSAPTSVVRRRRSGEGRRHHRQSSRARRSKTKGHHRRSAARGRAVRSAQAQGAPVISEIDGVVSSAATPRASAKSSSRRDRRAKSEYLIPKGAHL